MKPGFTLDEHNAAGRLLQRCNAEMNLLYLQASNRFAKDAKFVARLGQVVKYLEWARQEGDLLLYAELTRKGIFEEGARSAYWQTYDGPDPDQLPLWPERNHAVVTTEREAV